MSYFEIPKNLHLGARRSGEPLYIDPERRKTHMHVLGASGRGKSYFLEYLIRQDIRNSDGLCLIDPHGSLYEKVVSWCAEYDHIDWDKLILLDASAPDWTFGFNPLNIAGSDVSYSVDSMVNACAQVWGGEDTASTPLLKRALRGIFHTLAEQELTLLEANYLINERKELKPVREMLTKDLRDPIIREQWKKWNDLKSNEFRAEFASSTNRLMEFFAASVIRLIVGQTDPVIDFRRIMDDGAVVLINLASRGRVSDFNARTLGALITNDIFLKANGRPEGSRPFYLYIDECGRYLNESIQRILDESRKWGLHLILANQHLSQLKQAGDTVYSAVMTDAQTKVVFGGLSTDDAETMVKEVFLDLELEESKESLRRRSVVGQETVIMQSGGSSTSHTDAHSGTRGTGTTENEGESLTLLPDGEEGQTVQAWGVASSESESESDTSAETIAESDNWTETFRNIYEDTVGGHFTLEEQRYKKVAWLKKQPRQMALLVRPDFKLTPFRVATVRTPSVTHHHAEAFVTKRFEELPFVLPEKTMFKKLEERTHDILARAGLSDQDTNLTLDEEPDWFGNK